jgi:DNA-binding transcriptional LysR family regulator
VDWDDLRFFLQVARHRTLSAAARELGVTQPTAGRRIAALERRLGAKLFTRRPDGFLLSSSGRRILEHAERMEQDALAAERRVSGRDEGVRGTVRITASEWFVTRVLSVLVAPLLTRHPELSLELVADARHLNLARREADLALRLRRFEHDDVVQRSLGKVGFALYASHDYLALHGAPSAGGGAGHTLITMTDATGDIAREWLQSTLPAARSAARSNGRDALLALATAGAGLACLARVVGDAVPALRRLPLAPAAPSPTLWMGIHRDVRSTLRLRVVADHLAEQLRAWQPTLNPPD